MDRKYCHKEGSFDGIHVSGLFCRKKEKTIGKNMRRYFMKGNKVLALIVSIAVVLTSVISPTMAVAASYGAPAGWRDIPDFNVMEIWKDQSGTEYFGGGCWSSGEAEASVDTTPDGTYMNAHSLKFGLTRPGLSWLSCLLTLSGWASHDISGYLPNGYLEFYVKGQNGGEQFKIGAVDHFGQRRPVEIVSTVNVADYISVTAEWQHVKIPLKDIFDPSTGIDAYGAKAIVLDRVTDDPFTVWLNQIKLTTTDKERGYPAIKMNQVGYMNSAEKYALVSGFEDELNATVGTPFQVRRAADDSVAYSGQLVLVKNYDEESGERVLKAVFTDLKESGDYYITVDAEGIDKSLKFKIGNDIFKSLLADASRYYFYQRSGMDITEQYHDFPRTDPLPLDHVAVVESDPTRTRDVSKGWFDAGDHGKYMSSGAAAANTQLWSYDMFPESYADNTNIPESGNGVPDVLDEVRWELEWILKMQDTDGGMYGKVDDNQNYTQRVLRDMYDGVANVKPTHSTALAAKALAHASILYAQYDPVFANECLLAAENAWSYLEQHPDNIKGVDYTTDNDKESRFGAAAALYRATGEAKYNDYVLANYTQFNESFVNKDWDWVGSSFYAYCHYLKANNPNAEVVNWFKEKFTIYRHDRMERYNGNAWGNAINNGNYYWGSNNIVIGTALEILVGSKVLGIYNDEVRNMALGSLNYVLGANAMRKSFVTGYGEDSIKTVFATFTQYPGQGVPKGWIPLGVNRWNGGGSSNFPAKDYLDSDSEWTTNEHSVGANCNLMFITAFANSNNFTDQAAPVTTADVNPAVPDGSNGWYTSDVTVSLTATDDLSGVAKTEYSLDGGTTWQTYTPPVTFSQDGQYTVSYRSTDDALNEETAKTISFKLDTNAPAITINGVMNGAYNDSSELTPVITLDDSLSGVDANKTTVTLDGNSIEQGATIALYTLPLGSHTLTVTASDLAGNTSTKEIEFQTTTSIQSLQDLVTRFANAGWIDNAGIANSLQSKLTSNALEAFVNEVKAQKGKHISAEAADYLIRDAESLLS
jgi:endoglucanase